jgi:hypothetical protein
LCEKLGKLYDKRNSITHQGDRDVVTDDLLFLRETVGAFLQAMVQRRDEFKIGGRDALLEWIDKRMLGSRTQGRK